MNPKAFISYSWSSPAHQEWVLRLAQELRESGVDVILDKWDLREGHDAHAFMEQMVTDPAIEKVIMVCDKVYAEKANGRSGGVGAEAQIITPDLYGKRQQDKFVAVIAEKNDNGDAYLPAFYRSRIYIDLSDGPAYSQGFEQLLRWTFGRPVHSKPELGDVPSFLKGDTGQPKLLMTAKFRRATDLLKGGQAHAGAAVSEYFYALVDGLEKFRIKGADFGEDTFDDAVVQSLEEFLSYRNECVTLFSLLASYGQDDDTLDILHRFFEGLIPYMDRPEEVMSYREWDFDNFRFIIHELFLLAVAVLIKSGKFALVARFLETEFYVRINNRTETMQSYFIFLNQINSLEHRKHKLKLNIYSLRAFMLKDRCKGLPVDFSNLMQADFVLFLRAMFTNVSWYPFTIVYMGFMRSPFEIFARAKSKRYFNRIAPMLGVSGKEAFQVAIRTRAADPKNLPQWDYHTLPITEAAGIDEIGIRP